MKPFSEIPAYDVENSISIDLTNEIKARGKAYILAVDEQQYIEFLYDKFYIVPVEILLGTEIINPPVITKEKLFERGDYYTREVYKFTISYSYTGDSDVFKIQPTRRKLISNDIFLDVTNKVVSFSFLLYEQDPERFRQHKAENFENAFGNLEYANANVTAINSKLRERITSCFKAQKEAYLKENSFFAAINVSVNPNTQSIFSAPAIRKKDIPQPTVTKGKEFSSSPTMATAMYEDVLKVIYDSGKSMEKKPALYKGKGEEALRDQFLFVLETRYEGTTATGETFNKGGKTDILLKYAKDGTNIFVAECKFWTGASDFIKAISQLFDRYLTWRDSKAALMVFVKNKGFSEVINIIRKEVKSHPCYVKEHGTHGDSSFSYIFSLPHDSQKEVRFEIMIFHYNL